MKHTILLIIALFFSACSSSSMGYTKKYNYNHKPYIELKFKRQQLRESHE